MNSCAQQVTEVVSTLVDSLPLQPDQQWSQGVRMVVDSLQLVVRLAVVVRRYSEVVRSPQTACSQQSGALQRQSGCLQRQSGLQRQLALKGSQVSSSHLGVCAYGADCQLYMVCLIQSALYGQLYMISFIWSALYGQLYMSKKSILVFSYYSHDNFEFEPFFVFRIVSLQNQAAGC